MKGALRAIVLGSLLVTEQCSEPNAPVAGPPAIVSPAARIAFVTELPGGLGGFVYVANADGTGVRRLPGGQAYYSRPHWSPDGRRIVVSRWDPSSPGSSVVVIDVDGEAATVTLGNGSHAAWSPTDGRSHSPPAPGPRMSAFTSWTRTVATSSALRRRMTRRSAATDRARATGRPTGRLMVGRSCSSETSIRATRAMTAASMVRAIFRTYGDERRRHRLATTYIRIDDRGWRSRLVAGRSPIAYIANDGMYVVDSEGANPPRLVNLQNLNTGSPLSPAWSPDGKKLLFLAANPPNNKLAIVDIESGVINVLSFPTVSGLLLDPAWSR